MRAKILGKTEKKRIYKELRDRFGYEGAIPYGFLKIQDRIKVISMDFKDVKVRGLTIEDLGLLFGKWVEEDLILSMEGSQMIGPKATKNVVELDAEQMERWMTGGVVRAKQEDLEGGTVILKHNRDFLGCEKLSKGKIWSSIPPHRRIGKR